MPMLLQMDQLMMKTGFRKEVLKVVTKEIGPIAKPDKIQIVSVACPKQDLVKLCAVSCVKLLLEIPPT